jgi:hypothetical protein
MQQDSEPLHQQVQQHSSGLPQQSQPKSDQLTQQVHAVMSFDAASDAAESWTAAMQQDSEPLRQQVQQRSSGLPQQSQLESDQLTQQVHAVLSFDAASDAAEFSTAVSAFLSNRRSIQPPTTTDLYADFIGIQWMLSAQLLLLAAMFTRPWCYCDILMHWWSWLVLSANTRIVVEWLQLWLGLASPCSIQYFSVSLQLSSLWPCGGTANACQRRVEVAGSATWVW